MASMKRIDEILRAARKRRAVLLQELDAALIGKRDAAAIVKHIEEQLADNLVVIYACQDRLGVRE